MILDNKLNRQEIIILDGATGTEIARQGGVMDSSAWCGVANKTHPEVVRRGNPEAVVGWLVHSFVVQHPPDGL